MLDSSFHVTEQENYTNRLYLMSDEAPFDIQTSAIWMSELQAERMVYDEDRNLLALEKEKGM